MSTFGKTTTGSSSTLYNSGRMLLSQAVLTEAATLTSLSTQARTSNTTEVKHFQGVIYTDNAGAPGTLIAATAEGTLNDTSALWRTANFAGQSLSAGTYWIGVIADGTGTTNYYQYRDNTANMALAVANTYTSGPPATAPTMTAFGGALATYVTYTPTTIPSTNGNSASGTSITMTLPAYLTTDYLLLCTNSNNAPSITFSSGVTVTQIVTAGSRTTAWKVVPIDGSQTTFTATLSASSVLEWWIGNFRGYDLSATVYSASNAIGNSTSSTIPFPVSTAGYIATGNELIIGVAGVNSTATWTTDTNTIFYTTANNAAMIVESKRLPAGYLSGVLGSIDRGLNGTSRNQNSLSLILQPLSNNATINLLANPSFEQGSTIATSWQDEHSSVGTATYSIVTSPLTDGTKAQNIQYTGQSTDTSASKVEIFQAPITGMSPGDTITFSLYASGTITGTYAFIGIEGFLSGGTYIDETDTNLTGISSTPQLYSVSYVCKANNNYVAVYLQVPSLTSGTSFNITLDKATLTRTAGALPTGNIKVWNGSAWVAKPTKVWNGSAWVIKPVKVWNGSSWVVTSY